MKKIILTTILLFLAGVALAQNTMRIDTLSGKPGDTLTYSVKVDNVKAFVAYQLDIQLPAQLSYVNNSAALTGRANGHTFSAALISSTLIRALAYSVTMTPFNGNTGAVMTFKCFVTGNTPGAYNLNVVSPIISDTLNANILTASYNGKFTLLLPKIAFNTGSISFGRTLLGTNLNYNLYIYNNGTSNLTVTKMTSNSADIKFLDSSGITLTPGTNVLRTVRLYAGSRGIKNATLIFYSNDPIDSVHSMSATGEIYTINELYLNSVTAKYGYTGTLKIRMKNTDVVSAFQTSITLPASINYVAGSVILNPARKDDHVISASVLSGNILKIISYSPTNKPYLSNDSTIAQFNFIAKVNPGTYSIPITEGVISDTNGVNVSSNVYAGSISVISPVISVPASILFDTTSYTDTTRKTLAIQNTGNDTLVISGINATESSFANETALPVSIPPSNTRNFTIRFTNSVNGLHTGNLIINHSDSLRNPSSVAVSGFIYRPTRLRVTSSDFNSRDSAYLPFNITNKLPIVAFQFDVTLPPQALFIPNSAILTSRANGHQVYTSTLGNGDIRVIAYSMSQNRFLGDSGDVVKLKLAINADTGVYAVSVKNVIISDSNNTNIATGFNNGTFRVSPYPPALISPLNGSFGNEVNLSLYWSKSLFASYYHLQVSTDSLFTNILVNDSTRTDTTYSLTNLNILQSYYWRVRVKNYSGIYRFSNPWKFRTIGYPTQVVLSSPANNSIDQSLNPVFKWNKAIDQTLSPLTVSNYWFELATDSLFTNVIVRDSSLTDTTKSVSGLSLITNYFWRVKAKNQIGWALNSAVWKFTTIPPLPLAPVLIIPVNNSTGNPVNTYLVWSKPQYATGYNVVLATDAAFTNVVLNDSTLTDSLKALTNLNPLTTYYWKVRAQNVTGWGTFSSVFDFKTIGSPTQVTLSAPSNGVINQPTSMIFKWFKAVDQTNNKLTVSNYWIEYGTDSTFATVSGRDSILTDTTKSMTGLNNLTKYYWRVKAKNQIGWGAFSTVWNFTTIVAIPIAPLLLSPANNSTGISLTPALTWNTVSGAASYRLQVSTDSNFVTTQWDTTGVVGLTATVPAGKLSQTTKYYWRVNATNAGGTGAWSVKWNFTTLSLYLSMNLKVYLEGFWDGTSQVSDTAMVYLAAATTPFVYVDTAKIVLSTTGTASMNFNRVTTGSYYVVVNHRNHLETWSKLPQSFIGGTPLTYDFTTAITQAFGDNMKQVGSVWVLYGGDANRDGSVDATDIGIFVGEFGMLGYLSSDLNGDEDVNASDVLIISNNFGMIKIIPGVVPLTPEVLKNKKLEFKSLKIINKSKKQ